MPQINIIQDIFLIRQPRLPNLYYFNFSSISFSISSTVGKFDFKFSGIALINSYSDIPIGLLISFNEYSALTLFFSLHSNIPMDGLSSSVFKISSTA